MLSQVRLSRMFNGPDITVQGETFDFDASLTQLSAVANRFWSVGPRNRVFVYGGAGTSFDDAPLPTNQFALGAPFRLGAYSLGELRGPHYYVATGGYLRQVGRLPDFMGGPVFAGGWLENGDAFDEWSQAGWRTNGGRRTRNGHARGAGHGRRFVGLRRTLADVLGCGPDLSLRVRRIRHVGIWPSFCYLGRRIESDARRHERVEPGWIEI